MSLIPNNIDPSKDYVTPGVVPQLSINGLVYNKIYAHTGVIDSLTQTQRTGYTDPNTDVVNGYNNALSFDPSLQTNWISSQDFGGPTSTPVVVTYNLSNLTYYNNISLNVLNVPCFVELGYYTFNAVTSQYDIWTSLPGTSSFTVNGGADIYTTTDWIRLNYDAPATMSGVNNLAVRITRNKSVQKSNNQGPATNIAYSVGIENFSIRLQVTSNSDVPSTVVSGSSSIVTQNRFGFVEQYNYSINSVSNVIANDNAYWKSSPQPVQDAVVYFYTRIGTISGSNVTPVTINRLYIDPLYTGCKFNIYFSTQTSTSNSDPDAYQWTPIQRDFTLRKGLYEIPTVTATHLKFEFTKLAPEIYDLPFDSVDRTINVFPYDIEQYYYNLESNIINGNATQYSIVGSSNINNTLRTSSNATSSTLFGYGHGTVSNQGSWPSLSSLNESQYGDTTTTSLTTQSNVVDPSISYKLIGPNGQYNGQSYSEFLQRRFPDTRVHNYSQISIKHSWHEAYFVGVQYVTAFYENSFDDLRGTPSNLIAKNNTTSGFISQDYNYVGLNTNDTATTPWLSTIDTFKSFNIAGLTTDWRSFLTDSGTLLNLSTTAINSLGINATATPIGYLGISRIVQVSGKVGTSYGIKSAAYTQVSGTSNLLSYNEANFLTLTSWSGINTNISGTTVNFNTGTSSGTGVNALGVSGSALPAVAYNFTIPNVFSASGTKSWMIQFGAAPYGVLGYASYNPASGVNYYFTVNATSSSTNTVGMYTRFLDPNTNLAIAGTTVSGNQVTITGAATINTATLTGTNYAVGLPSNIIQVVVSGSANTAFSLSELGVFTTPGNAWSTPQNRINARISGVARIMLPDTNRGTYRVSLFGTTSSNTVTEIAYKVYTPGSIPINTWMDIELENYTGYNYTNLNVQVNQVDTTVAERFLVSMLSPFYHPIRYEYITVSGATNWQPITTGINDWNQYISTVSGVAASGIQVRMTALDPNVYVAGVSIIPYYKQSPYFAELDINYTGSSKTNELSARRHVANKPYFQLNKELYPSKWSISNLVPNITSFFID